MHYRSLAKRVGNAVRLAEVIQVFVKHGFADLVRRTGFHEGVPAKLLRGLRIIDAPSGAEETTGQRLRAALCELGPTFIKFGQVLSTRPDLIGQALCQDLNRLQDQVDSLPFDQMEPILLAAMGGHLEARFATFDKEPVASASISQVYCATLLSGELTAVKVQRPGVKSIIEADLSLLRTMAEWVAEHVEDFTWADPVGMVDEFARSMRRELDFSIEAKIIERFHDNYRGDASVFVPRVYRSCCSSQVLVMDWVDGIRVDAIDKYAERGCDAAVVARVGCETLCKQVFDHHFFHADPHPGNILVTKDNQIAFLDYGMVGHLEDGDVFAIADILRSVYEEDSEACARALLHFTVAGEMADRDVLVYEISDYMAFEAQSILGGGHVSKAMEHLTDILRRNRLTLAPRFSLLIKALATIESTGRSLDPKLDMLPIIRPYVEQVIKSRFEASQLLSTVQDDISSLVRLLRELPLEIQDLLRLLRRGRLKMQITHEGLDHLTTVTDRASNRVAFGIIMGSLIIGSSLLMSGGDTPQRIGMVGYVTAGMLGLLLAFSILRSRNF